MTDTHTQGRASAALRRHFAQWRPDMRHALCAGPIMISLVVLAGWVLDVPILKSIVPGMPTMKANTAVGLLAAGWGTWLVPRSRRAGGRADARAGLALFCGALALILGAVTLAEYLLGLRLGLDELLFADPHTTSPPYPGRMSPASAAGFVCAGTAILLLCGAAAGAARTKAWRRHAALAAHLLATVPACIGYLGITGYAYHVDRLYNFGAFVAVALHTALGFAMLAPAILLTQAPLGWARALVDFPVSRQAFRRVLPLSLLMPFLAGLAVVWGARARIYDPLYGPALFALASAAGAIGMAWISALVVRGAERRLGESNARLAASQLALRVLNDSLEHRVGEEVAAREAAQSLLAHGQKMEAIGQLAGGIAHDFNNVMQAIQGGAGLIRRRTSDPRAVDDIARMVEVSVQRGISITRRLLAFARRDELRAECVDPVALLGELREVLVHGFGSQIDIRIKAPEAGAVSLFADRGQLETVMVNLAANGRDAMAAGGVLTLAAEEEAAPEGLSAGRYLRLSVCDTGVGMPHDVLARAAEPFFTTKATGQGTGLGLAMARSFAEQSGGRLAISSAPGRGTSVSLWLPAASAKATKPVTPPAVIVPASASATILVVDDEDLVREVLARGLTDLGYTVLQAGDADTALAMLRAGAPVAVLLTDYAMPGTNGLALIKAARATCPGLPAVLLTGNAAIGPAGEPEGISLLRKPARADELAACIAGVLEPAEQRKKAVLF